MLFLDEPTSNLDPAAKKEIEAMLAAFAADGMTLVMSTHNLGQAKRLATRVIYLDSGEIRADLPTERFFAEHADLPLRRSYPATLLNARRSCHDLAAPTIDKEQITGMVLAGGRGSRMGGVDKGLQGFRGMPLAMHALFRLQPQVGETMINANRNLAAYESMGVPVWPDALPDYPGPLAGFLAGLERCETPYLVVVPCDTPLFPEDLVERLAEAFADESTEIAVAATREGGVLQAQPVFCMMRADGHGKPGPLHPRGPAQDRPLDRAACHAAGRVRERRRLRQRQHRRRAAAAPAP